MSIFSEIIQFLILNNLLPDWGNWRRLGRIGLEGCRQKSVREFMFESACPTFGDAVDFGANVPARDFALEHVFSRLYTTHYPTGEIRENLTGSDQVVAVEKSVRECTTLRRLDVRERFPRFGMAAADVRQMSERMLP